MKFWRYFLRGACCFCALLCALCYGAEVIAGAGDYKNLVDDFLGGSSASAGSVDTYAFQSDYDTLEDMLTERKRIAEQIAEEGAVLLKNEEIADGKTSLPLRQNGQTGEIRATVLGSRAYTYKEDGVTLRDTSLTFYGGITGSKIYEQTVTLNDGSTLRLPVTMDRALATQNIIVNPNMVSFYSNKPFPTILTGSEGSGNSGGAYAVNEPAISLGDVADRNNYNDVCFVVIGRCSGEGRDYFPGSTGVFANDSQTSAIGLSAEERNLIAVANDISDNVVVIINSAITMEIDELAKDERVDSILWIGLPGSYGLNGVARVISGEAAPSGHLSDTYAVEAKNSPAAQNFGVYTQTNENETFTWSRSSSSRTGTDDSHYVVLAEGLYTGYSYYETRYYDTVVGQGNASLPVGASGGASSWAYENEVTYPFGYGMSYSAFEQKIVEDSFRYNGVDKTVSLSVVVTNVGDYPAKDVVQLYVSTPYTAYDKANGVEKSAIQLISFGKTQTLEPGEEEEIVLTADIKYFASYDKTASHDGLTGGYIMEAGDYYFAIGNGAHEALNNVIAASKPEYISSLVSTNGVEPDADKTYVWSLGSASAQTGTDFSFSNGVDVTYFSRSDNGTVISNQMADADYNYFKEGAVTYLSRSDWAGTFPKSYTFLDETAAMKKYLDDHVYEFGTSGTTNVEFGVDHSEEEDENGVPAENMSLAELKLAAFEDNRWDYLLSQITFDEAWMFSPYGGSSCIAFTSVNAPEVWQIDGPNGNVTRGYGSKAPESGYLGVSKTNPNAGYYSADMPCAPMVAATFNRELLEEQGKIYGEDNLWSRNPIMWAPGMNLHRTPFNSRNHEYYSEDPMLTNLLGTAFVRGGVQKGSILAAKHFAFNTQESFREGLAQFMEEQSAREHELRAFQGLSEDVGYVNEAGNTVNALGLMSSFSRTGVCNVNAHTGVIKNILRKEWGFKGLISTDMVVGANYSNPQDSVVNNVTFMATSNAGNLLNTADWQDYNNKSKVRSDPNMINALYDNMHYYMYSIANSIALNGIAPGDIIQTGVKSWWEYMLIGLGSGFAALTLTAGSLLIVAEVRNKKNETKEEQHEQATI